MPQHRSDIAARFLAAQALARAAGLAALRLQRDRALLQVQEKGPHDLVTAGDRLSQDIIAQAVAEAFPGDGFLGEEGDNDPAAMDRPFTWIIDPVDGTANYAAGRPDWCVSVGVVAEGSPIIGAIYMPATDLLFAALSGGGATRNGVPISVSARPSLEGATIAVDYSVSSAIKDHADILRRLTAAGADFRRSGSAACQLAQVADGLLDGFVETSLNAWDVCAGIVLVTEAGGWASDFFAGPPGPKPMLASNPLIAASLRRCASG